MIDIIIIQLLPTNFISIPTYDPPPQKKSSKFEEYYLKFQLDIANDI